MIWRALEIRQTNPNPPAYISQLLGADVNYFAGKFCSKPFGDFEIGNDGRTFICCPNYLPVSIGNAIDGKMSLPDLLNSESATRIRRSITEQTFHYCDWMQCSDIQMERLPAINTITDPDQLAYIKAGDGIISGIKDARLSLDSTCNLWCPSCRSERITAKGEQFERIMETTERIVVPALKAADTVMMNGYGDIFSSRSCRRILESISSETHPNLGLVFITNGVLFSQEEWEKFPNIHQKVSSVRVSIDAASKATYNRVRLGGNWEKLNENLTFLSRLRTQGQIKKFLISFVIQRDNFREMSDFYRRGLSLGCDNIVFEHLMDWRSWNEATFRKNAVHLPDNPEHQAYIEAVREVVALTKVHGRRSFDIAMLFP
jgi:sulfatase maturation enzyme AslB (radical SAM superfamily)